MIALSATIERRREENGKAYKHKDHSGKFLKTLNLQVFFGFPR
jgi:hypothetical protein